jgi:hypothetical protein
MSTIDEIKLAIHHLSRKDLELFRAWFYEYEANAWDTELAEDVQAGKLDPLAEQAIKDLEQGRCTDL